MRTGNLIVIMIAVTALCPAFSQESSARIALEVRSTDEDANGRLGDIIYDLVAIELEWGGFTVRPSSEAEDVGPRHKIVVEHGSNGDKMIFRYTWTDRQAQTVLASLERTVAVGLGMDTSIAASVRGLVAKAGVNALMPTRSPTDDTDLRANGGGEEQRERSEIPVPGSGGSAGGPSGGPGTRAGESRAAIGARDPAGTTGLPSARETVRDGSREARRRAVTLSAGGGSLLAIGQASRYFRVAPGAALFLGYEFAGGLLTIGLDSAAVRFYAEGVSLSTVGYLGGVGPALRLDLGRGTAPFLQVSGGPAVLALDNERTGLLYTILPFAGGEVGLPVSFGPSVGLLATVDFTAYFEGSMLIMGITPAVELSVRL